VAGRCFATLALGDIPTIAKKLNFCTNACSIHNNTQNLAEAFLFILLSADFLF
jgi:hypothetical protein